MITRTPRLPKKAFLEMTRACNLACTHCLNGSGQKMGAEFRAEEILDLIRRLAAFGIMEIRFTGGEPTIHPALEEAITVASNLNLQVSIGSNAVAITNEYADSLFCAGLKKAIVSVDGDELFNDAVRGHGSFRRTWQGIRALRSSGVDVRVNAVAMKSALAGLRSLGELCAIERIPLFIRRYIPSGRSSGNLSEIPTSKDYARLNVVLRDLVDDGIVDGHHLSSRHETCSAGTGGIVILPNGDVQSCGFLSELGESPYGNVRSEDLMTIWRRIIDSPFLIEQKTRLAHWINTDPDVLLKTNCCAVAVVGGKSASVQFRRRTR